MNLELRAGDIYTFQYNQAEYERLGFSARHCFEGTLHLRELNGELRLVDTYWGIGGDGRQFTIEEAERKGTLTLYCNLNDVEPIRDYEQAYYADDDLFVISEQHGCAPRCVHWFKRKGASRNADKMLRVVRERVQAREAEISYATNQLKHLAEIEQQIRGGQLDVYL